MELYRVSSYHFWSDLQFKGEFVVFGLALMKFDHGGVGFNLALLGIRLSVHFNTKSGIERQKAKWAETLKKLNEVTGTDWHIR